MSERELDGEEALLAAGSYAWDQLPKHIQEKIRNDIRNTEDPETAKNVAKAIRAGRRLRKEGGAKK